MEDGRVEPGPACERGRAITLRWNGRSVPAYEGETVGAALHAAGERAIMRSIKYHRPRGLFCCTGKCASCLVRVDGTPNVRACVTPVRDGMDVRTQNAFPSARRDLFSVVDKVYPETFDYHQRFIRPRALTPVYHKVIRAMAGFGRVPDLHPAAPRRPPIRRVEVDVAVVGAGPSGLSAAAAAAEGAASVLCVDESDRAGGSLLLTPAGPDAPRDGVEVAADLAARVADAGGEVLARSVAFGLYLTDGRGDALAPPGVLAVLAPERVLDVRARALVVASGHHETPALFGGNDLPGVMGARAALILLRRHGVLPGRRVALLGEGAVLDEAEAALRAAGAEVAGVVGRDGWQGATLVEARGGDRVERIELARDGSRPWTERVDCVLVAGGETPRVEILQQAGCRMAWRGAYLPDAKDVATSVPGVFAAGSVLGPAPLAERIAQGARAGEAAAAFARARVREVRA
ncbi:MAG TPA: 2Fe-2S iron-sulfur cluster-binding protein [Candidatus Thermoplasmatota archaeon]|nr:2Fe-2S iron-sulfur cluster-binding protein [Candidatus Thermoplasmatota archaeon]